MSIFLASQSLSLGTCVLVNDRSLLFVVMCSLFQYLSPSTSIIRSHILQKHYSIFIEALGGTSNRDIFSERIVQGDYEDSSVTGRVEAILREYHENYPGCTSQQSCLAYIGSLTLSLSLGASSRVSDIEAGVPNSSLSDYIWMTTRTRASISCLVMFVNAFFYLTFFFVLFEYFKKLSYRLVKGGDIYHIYQGRSCKVPWSHLPHVLEGTRSFFSLSLFLSVSL